MLLDQEFIDSLWAKRVCQLEHLDKQVLPLLSHLMASARHGHLCMHRERIPAELKCLWPLLPSKPGAVIVAGDRLYLQKNFRLQELFLQEWTRLNSAKPSAHRQEDAVAGLLPRQKLAVQNALSHSITLITGGPGTGKTYTAGKLIQSLVDCRVAMAAPTGKAAMTLTQSIGCGQPAQTLHNLLGIRPGQELSFNERPLPILADLVLVDECSMIDLRLMVHLLRALKSGTRLVLLGDRHQLPPVESGMVFADLCQSVSNSQVTELTDVMRVERQELISFADGVNSGQVDKVMQMLQGGSSVVQWRCTADLHQCIRTLQPRWKRGDRQQLLEQLREFAFLSPLRKGPYGVETLNELVAKTQPPGSPMPIMVLENDYRLDLFNGEVGVLCDGMAIFSGNPPRSFPVGVLPRFEPGYCLSVHKSQGSEFNRVCLLLPEGSEVFGRQVLYTAVTRAKQSLSLIGNRQTLAATIRTALSRESGIEGLI